MGFSKITPQWLKKQKYLIQSTYTCPTIEGVFLEELKANLVTKEDLKFSNKGDMAIFI